MSTKWIHVLYGTIVAGALVAGGVGLFQPLHQRTMSIEEKRALLVALEKDIQGELYAITGYRCCLEQPCSQCVGHTPGHGEGARCDCLEEVVTGAHPCNECLGGILAGDGNPLLAEYFSTAVADGVGPEAKPAIVKIITQKYGVPAERQL